MPLGIYLGSGSAVTRGLWHLEGNSNDSSGNANNGTDTSMSYGLGYGKFGKGGTFNGSSTYITIPSNASLRVVSPFTLSIWMKTSSATMQILMGKANYSTDLYGYEFFIANTGKIYFYVDGSTGGNYMAGTKTGLGDGKWHNIVAVATGTDMYIYVDGLQDKTAGQTYDCVYTTEYNGYIGAEWSSSLGTPTKEFNGYLDEAIIESKAWTAVQVRKYYTFSQGRFGI